MSEPSAKVLSHSRYGSEWTFDVASLEIKCHRFVLAEFNTHRAFSRNSASSRAIPFPKQVERVMSDPAIPLVFPAEQKGMQGGEELDRDTCIQAEAEWLLARDRAVESATALHGMGVHKSVVNRLLEPFMWHTIVVTSAEWDNFFRQRCSPLAQPEIQAVAYAMRSALDASVPDFLEDGQWHMPYLDADTIIEVSNLEDDGLAKLRRISAARCARVSYLTQDGQRLHDVDLELFDRLATADPPHWSPLEHVCRPPNREEQAMMIPGNLMGWVQLRHCVDDQFPWVKE